MDPLTAQSLIEEIKRLREQSELANVIAYAQYLSSGQLGINRQLKLNTLEAFIELQLSAIPSVTL